MINVLYFQKKVSGKEDHYVVINFAIEVKSIVNK